MAKITEPGTYLVTITNAEWKPCRNGMQAHLTGETASGDYIVARMAATPTILSKGKNAGKTLAEATIASLVEIGLPVIDGDPQPMQLGKLKGRQAEFVCAIDTFKGEDGEEREFITVSFVNAVGGAPAATPKEVNDFFSGIGFKSCEVSQDVPTGTACPDADIPF